MLIQVEMPWAQEIQNPISQAVISPRGSQMSLRALGKLVRETLCREGKKHPVHLLEDAANPHSVAWNLTTVDYFPI